MCSQCKTQRSKDFSESTLHAKTFLFPPVLPGIGTTRSSFNNVIIAIQSVDINLKYAVDNIFKFRSFFKKLDKV